MYQKLAIVGDGMLSQQGLNKLLATVKEGGNRPREWLLPHRCIVAPFRRATTLFNGSEPPPRPGVLPPGRIAMNTSSSIADNIPVSRADDWLFSAERASRLLKIANR
jgi:hypothetical protein